MRIALSIFIIATTLFPGAALAQTAAERQACEADFKKFCPGVEPGGGRVVQCLAEHLADLTPECQKVVQTHMPK